MPDSPYTFLTSNAVAQERKLNRGEWQALYKIAVLPDGQMLFHFAVNASPKSPSQK